jgi:hypothetical protein
MATHLHRERMAELALGARVEAMKAAAMIAGTRVNRAFTVSDVIGDAVLIADFIITGEWRSSDPAGTEEKIA